MLAVGGASVKAEVRFLIESVPVLLALGRKITSRAARTFVGSMLKVGSPWPELTKKLMKALLLPETASVLAVPADFVMVVKPAASSKMGKVSARNTELLKTASAMPAVRI